MLEINYTLFFQIANFLFLLCVLNIVLYRPIRRILVQRSEEVQAFEGMIAELRKKSGHHAKELEENGAAVKKEGHKERETIRGDGVEREKVMLREATSSATEKIDQARMEIDKKVVDARRSLEAELATFSKELAEKILGRTV